MRSLKAIAVLASTCALAACGNPTVRFEKAKGPDLTGAAKYQFLASTLEFGRLKPPDPAPGAAPAKPADNSIAMTVRPVPDPSAVYYLTGADWSQAWGVSTALSSAYSKTNPLILESIGTETTDRRKEIIASVGGLLTAIVPFALLADIETDGNVNAEADDANGNKVAVAVAIPPDLPLARVLPDIKNATRPGDCELLYDYDGASKEVQEARAKRDAFIGGSRAVPTRCDIWLDSENEWQIGDPQKANPAVLKGKIEFGPVRESASSRVAFDAVATRDTSVMFYSACRSVTLTISQVKGVGVKPVAMTALVADPNWVETAKLLYKGTISLLTPCGVSVGEEKGSAPNPLDGGTELFKQFKAVKDAYKPPAK